MIQIKVLKYHNAMQVKGLVSSYGKIFNDYILSKVYHILPSKIYYL